MKSISKQVSFD